MLFASQSDIMLQKELQNNGVVRPGLDGLSIPDKATLLDVLILNKDKVDTAKWLHWLTSIRKVYRFASLTIDPDWVSKKRFPAALRREAADDCVFPVYESGGTIVCASLRGDRPMQDNWAAKLSSPVIMVAPSLAELAEIRKYFFVQ